MSNAPSKQDNSLFNKEQVSKITTLLFTRYKIDFSDYKSATVKRRIERRIAALNLETLKQYVQHLEQHHDEIELLYKELLISVTAFFRDPKAFELLNKQVMPELLKRSMANKQEIRIWVPACSTGEEVYSLAICLAESAEQEKYYLEAKIFATDINSQALEVASEGIYSTESIANIPEQYLHKYFDKKTKSYQIKKHIRSMVVFAPYNLICDPPFTRMDLISCRNFLIYINTETQKKVVNSLRFGLRDNGYLLLGPSESVGNKLENLERIDTKWKLYQKTKTNQSTRLTHSHNHNNNNKKHIMNKIPSKNNKNTKLTKPYPFPLYAYHEAIKELISLGFILDANRKVVHTFGNISKLLHVPEGVIDTDILNMINSELKVPLNTGLHRAKKTNEVVRYNDVYLEHNSNNLSLIVTPIKNELNELSYYLVYMQEDCSNNINQDKQQANNTFNFDIHAQQVINELEGELKESRDLLQASMEEVEATNEELQSTNEELLASNEELQSTNEELHSANVELSSVNHEYQKKLDELTLLDNDVDNLLRSIDIGTVFVDENKSLKLFTPAAQNYFNILATDIGRPISHFSHDIIDFNVSKIFILIKSTLTLYETELKTNTGLWLLLRATPSVSKEGNFTGVIYSFTDITHLKQAEKSLAQLAHFDSLTKLPNRSSFMEALDKSVMIAETNQAHIAVFFVDLDNFKQINDCLGHAAGDELLITVSKKMQTLIYSTNNIHYIARLAGDEFGVIINDVKTITQVKKIAKSFVDAFKEPLFIAGRDIKTSLSIGIAIYPDGGNNSDELIRHADMAMYHAKQLGKDTYLFFNDEINQYVTKKHLLENSLHKAVENEELSIVFQPQYDLNTNKLIGFEVLTRWYNATIGEINPEEFIRIAESSKLIINIGEWIITSACNAFSELKNKPDDLILAINISAKQLMVNGLTHFITKTLDRYKINPNQLVLELTESCFVYRSAISTNSINQLKALGVKFALDDFGIGYSSLQYLKELPISILKIDQGFVRNISENSKDNAIVQSIIALANGLGMEVIAEGVETLEQVTQLKQQGCYLMQGYLLGKPIEPSCAMSLIKANSKLFASIS